MKDTMTKKEFSAYTEELMGDILFRVKGNGGSMLKDTMDNIIEDIYKHERCRHTAMLGRIFILDG